MQLVDITIDRFISINKMAKRPSYVAQFTLLPLRILEINPRSP
jgi:hypothetical protein